MADNKTSSRWTIEEAIEFEEYKIRQIDYERKTELFAVDSETYKDLRDFHCCIIEWLKELKEIREHRA